MTRYIYALLDPISTQVFYVGQTSSMKKNKIRHNARDYCKNLAKRGYEFEHIILQTIKGNRGTYLAEQNWIRRFLEAGAPLENMCNYTIRLRVELGLSPLPDGNKRRMSPRCHVLISNLKTDHTDRLNAKENAA